MQRDAKSWDRYADEIREFDLVLAHARAVSDSLVGTSVPSPHASYGEQIFVKLLSHCICLRRLLPDPGQRATGELWDVSSLSAIARCVIEAHDAFEYVAGHAASDAERELRLLLWELHDKTRRARMLEAIGSVDPRTDDIRADAARLKGELESHALYETLRKDDRKKIAAGDPPAYHLSQRERCIASGINHEYYNAVTMQLSQHVHSLPFSIHQLFAFKAGSQAALHLMSMPARFALPFLARVTEGMAALLPGKTPPPPKEVAKSMAIWRGILKKGLADAA